MYPQKFDNMIQQFHKIPGVGLKSAERMAFAVLNWDEDQRAAFTDTIKKLDVLKKCEVCGNLSEDSVCSICSDHERNHNLICVVESIKDLYAIENLGEFNGVYHVLGGTINVKKGLLPEDLNIQNLIDRINDQTEEIILALEPNAEGELTSEYVTRLLDEKTKISRLAYGIPVGGKLDYADQRTLKRALEGRTQSKRD